MVSAAELDTTVADWVGGLLKGGPRAVTHSKQLIFHAAGHNRDAQLALDQHTARLIAGIRVSPEGQEGMQAFLSKRPARWTEE
jgi:methylglutaconyl-CoA hydratase